MTLLVGKNFMPKDDVPVRKKYQIMQVDRCLSLKLW